MKKVFLVLCLCILVLPMATSVHAEEEKMDSSGALIDTRDMKYYKSPAHKLGRGAINVATCWMEVPADISRVTAESNGFAGWTLGLGEGILTTFFRAASGVFDAATFALPPYNRPVMLPEYASDSLAEGFQDSVDAQARPE
jgi:putative exosortase-associated protein (TIGR04073 family)